MEREKLEMVADKIQEKWGDLSKNFYMCYNVYELAYKVVADLQEAYDGTIIDCPIIYQKKYEEVFKFCFEIDDSIFITFNVLWVTGMYGDTGLKVNNARIKGKLPMGYKEIDLVEEIEKLESEEA